MTGVLTCALPIYEKLDELAQALVSDECDKIAILAKVDEIRGLLLDILA